MSKKTAGNKNPDRNFRVYFSLFLIITFLISLWVIFRPVAGPVSNQTFSPTPTPIPSLVLQPADFRATFEININGVKRIFTDKKYHNLNQDVFITANNPAVIHVKKAGLTWDDFFKTLPMKIDRQCITTGTGERYCSNETKRLRFYLNGEERPNLLDEPIAPVDSIRITY